MAYPVKSHLYSHPVKAIYALLAVIFEALRMPKWILFSIIPQLRPHRTWSFRQALAVRIVKAFLQHSSAVHAVTQESLKPGKEGSRFVVLEPAQDKYLTGIAVDKSGVVKPGKFGATWTKAPLTRSQVDDNVDVVLHFHGGAFVIGDGRDHDTGFLAATLIKHARVSHVLTPQYRLSSNLNGHFPAALQDAIASYTYLLNMGVSASRISISGDSAGANLTLCLLRYIAEHGSQVGLPWPGAVLLWSPWVNLTQAYDTSVVSQSPNFQTDYIPSGFGHWGALTYTRDNAELMANRYVSPLNNPFKSKSPIYIQTGSGEVLYPDNCELADELQREGNNVKLVVKEHCPHDIILTGPLIGFEEQARDAAKKAGEFLRENRLVEGSSAKPSYANVAKM